MTMIELSNKERGYDLEERTYQFAKCVFLVCGRGRKIDLYTDNVRQVLRSSGSIGANYIEANESLGKKDFAMKIRICLKEAKETAYWLRLLIETDYESESGLHALLNEAIELKKIFAAILIKTGN